MKQKTKRGGRKKTFLKNRQTIKSGVGLNRLYEELYLMRTKSLGKC